MSTKRQLIEFATNAIEAGWPEDRIDSLLYCNLVYDTPLPHESWSPAMIESHSNKVLELSLIHISEPTRPY